MSERALVRAGGSTPRPRWRAPRRGWQVAGRRTLQVALGILWLLDGALQLQPFMFSKGFATQIIAPTATGQPELVRDAVHWSASLILSSPVAWDALFAGIQLLIGIGFLFRRTVRPAIVVSILWALGVWLLGEGLGGLGSGATTFIAGAPGAVILYPVIGLAAWPQLAPEGRAQVLGPHRRGRERARALLASRDDQGVARWVTGVWVALWALFALLRLLPANDSAKVLSTQVASSATGAPGWLAGVSRSLAGDLSHAGIGPVVAIAAAYLCIGVLAVAPGRWRTVSAWSGIAVALAVWVVGQAFGQIPTGMGTDPNSGLLVALMGVAVLGRARSSEAGEPAVAGRGREREPHEPSWERRLDVA